VLGAGVDVPATFVLLLGPVDLVGEYLSRGKFALPGQFWVPLRAGDAEPLYVSRTGAEASVTKIEAQKVGIWHLR
jgi:hypothetical protein